MRHGAKKLAETEGVQIVDQILLGDSTAIASILVGGIQNLVFLDFSRNDEYQADSCGISYSFAAHYNPYGMKNFFITLKKLYGDAPFEAALSDHPTTSDRITNAQRLINKLHPMPPNDSTGTHTDEYLAIRKNI